MISYKRLSDGKNVPYELNINYYDAINNPNTSTKGESDYAVKKFLASQAVMILSKGVPGIYIHSLIGSRNWKEGVSSPSENRKINREKLNYDKLVKELLQKPVAQFSHWLKHQEES